MSSDETSLVAGSVQGAGQSELVQRQISPEDRMLEEAKRAVSWNEG